jgi:YXWGXW repeat-containing protein
MLNRPVFVSILGGILLVAAGCASTPPKAQTTRAPVRIQTPPPMPAAPAEVQPAQPGSGYAWIPGHYEWRSSERTYVWVPGTWMVAPPDQTWVPGHWETRSNGSAWVQSHWQPTVAAGSLAASPPPMPAPPAETRPAQPGSGYVWIPGRYEWRSAERNYVWVPGNWTVAPSGYTWVPGRWENRPEGNVWVNGHWQRS